MTKQTKQPKPMKPWKSYVVLDAEGRLLEGPYLGYAKGDYEVYEPQGERLVRVIVTEIEK